MLKAQQICVAGAALEGGALRVAAMLTDGDRIASLEPGGSLPVPPGADPETIEDAHAHAFAAVPQADLFGIRGGSAPGDLALSGHVLAQVLGRPVVWDMRAADRQMGGQGGPLRPVFLRALAAHLGLTGPLAFVDPGAGRLCHIAGDGALSAFDTGPGLCGIAPDDGTADRAQVAAFLEHSYFLRLPPKRCPPDLRLPEGSGATQMACVLAAVTRGLELAPQPPAQVIVTGAGAQGDRVCARLGQGTGLPVRLLSALRPDLDEADLGAWAVAYLAARVARGLPTSFPGTTGVPTAVSGGQISRPGRGP